MLICKKHPDSVSILAADFSKRLSSGETLSAVTQQPVMILPLPGNTDLTFGSATINTTGVLNVPNIGQSIAQNQGVSFSVSGGLAGTGSLPDGNTGTLYEFEFRVSTSNSPRVIAAYYQLWVSTAY